MEKLSPLKVSQLNRYVRMLFQSDNNLKNLLVMGEISNCIRHRSGHIYMTLKDSEASIKAVMFRDSAQTLLFEPNNGMSVIVFGTVSLYERDGQYQLYIDSMMPVGEGEELLKFAKLKSKLEGLGYFDESRKRPLPAFPERIGLITSETGAAVKDVLSVLQRRYPQGEVFLYPCLVQGDKAAESVIKGIKYFNDAKNVDVIIITRGGGSSEDLSAFNDEGLATAAYLSEIPIVSAVGHEIDYTILDYTADMRAPTPSAAAERVSPDNISLRSELDYYSNHIKQTISMMLKAKRLELDLASEKCDPSLFINGKKAYIDGLYSRTLSSCRKIMFVQKALISEYAAKLSALSPLNTLGRGYAAVTSENTPVTSVNDVTVGDKLELTLKDGRIYCNAEKIAEQQLNT